MYFFHISTETNLSSEYIIAYFKNQFNAEKSGILLKWGTLITPQSF